jgi:hypothetical protein
MPNKKSSASTIAATSSNVQLTRIIILIALLLFIGTAWFGWRNVVNSPRRVFYDMLDSSMRSRSISKRVIQDNGLQKLDQRMQLQTGDVARARSISTLSQGDDMATSVTTESIGSPNEDYVRYLSIETNQKSVSGEDFDFDHVLGVWGKAESPSNAGSDTSGQLFGEVTLGVVPMGQVRHDDRQKILEFIRDQEVYVIDFSDVAREIKNGRPRYVYDVSMSPEKYVTMLKQFGRSVGLEQLEAFDPASFRDSPALKFKFAVDVWSRQLVGVQFVDTGRIENYSGYGAESTILIPEQTIPVEELQSRLQTIQ